MKLIRSVSLISLIAILGFGGAAFAQSGRENGPPMDYPGGNGEMAGSGKMGRSHEFVRNKLGLTEDQAQKLRQLRIDYKKGTIRRHADLRIARLDLREILEQKTIDPEKVEKKVRQIEGLRGDLQIFRIQSMMKAKDFLSDEQFAKFKHMILAHSSHRWRGRDRMHWTGAMHHDRDHESDHFGNEGE